MVGTGQIKRIFVDFTLLFGLGFNLTPEFCMQKLSVRFGTQLPEFSGSGNGCPTIQVL
jgi:hypothetical protein